MSNYLGQLFQLKLNTRIYLECTLFSILMLSACASSRMSTSSVRSSQKFTHDSIYRIMKKAADWQIDSIRHKGWRHPERDWNNGALYAGLHSFGSISNDSVYYSFLKETGEQKYLNLVDRLWWRIIVQ